MDIKDLDIKVAVHAVRHEQTPEITGKESVLFNYGLMLKNSGASLDKLKEHFDSALEHGLDQSPTWLLKFDTRSVNALNYYNGVVTISLAADNRPRIGCYTIRRTMNRNYNEDIQDWVDSVHTHGIGLDLILDGVTEIDARGDGISPNDLSDHTLLKLMMETCEELSKAIEKLPVVTSAIDNNGYMKQVMSTMAMGGSSGQLRLWNLVAWDIYDVAQLVRNSVN